MKKSIIFTLIIALFSIGNIWAQDAKTDKFTVEINGMGCPYCASGIENEFKKLKEITDIKIDISTGTLTFVYPPEMDLSLEKVKSKVSDAGYTPVNAKVERANGKTETSKAETASTKTLAKSQTERFLVAGECGMCKERIEIAAKNVSGVSEASWNMDSKKLTVNMDPEKTSVKEVQKAVAAVGHDTEAFKTTDEAYENLHACCHYERLE